MTDHRGSVSQSLPVESKAADPTAVKPSRGQHPHPPVVGRPDCAMRSRLQQRGEWMSADGVWHALHGMTTVHLWNVIGYLRWFAPDIFPSVNAVEPGVFYEALSRTAVVDGITEELVRRGEVADAEDAWHSLRASGPVPWELTYAGPHDEKAEDCEA